MPSRSRCLFLIWLMAALSCGQAQVIAITHARLLDGTGTPAVDDATILIEGKTIKAVGRSDLKIPAGAHVIDAKRKTAIPGLADMHVHLTGGWDGEATDILGYQTYLNALLYSGVTTVLDTGNIPPLILQLRGAVASGILQGPRIYCVGPLVEGPDPIWGPISLVMTSKAQIPSVIAQLKSANVDLVKLYAGLSDQLVRGISAEAKKQGLRTIIDQGHRNGSMDLMDEGIAGFAHLPSHRISDETVGTAGRVRPDTPTGPDCRHKECGHDADRPLLADSNRAHHAAGFAFFGAVGEQQLGMAVGAEWGRLDTFLGHSCGEQLLAVRFH